MRPDEEEWVNNHPALQDGACLQALEAKQIYDILRKWFTHKISPVLHQEILEDAKDKVQQTTGWRPTNEKLLKGIRALKVPLRLKDHIRCMLVGKIKCGSYWSKIPGYTERANCTICKKKRSINILESAEHIWLECENNGQSQAWRTAETIWHKLTTRNWPPISMGMLRGAAAISFKNDYSKDSE